MMSTQCLKLGSKQEKSAKFCPIERLYAKPIPPQLELTLATIPHADSEHANKALHCRVDSVGCESLQHHFGIGMSAKFDTARFEFGTQFLEIVDLAIVRNDDATVRGAHRWRTGRRWFEQGG